VNDASVNLLKQLSLDGIRFAEQRHRVVDGTPSNAAYFTRHYAILL
jgi:hypothetical protein